MSDPPYHLCRSVALSVLICHHPLRDWCVIALAFIIRNNFHFQHLIWLKTKRSQPLNRSPHITVRSNPIRLPGGGKKKKQPHVSKITLIFSIIMLFDFLFRAWLRLWLWCETVIWLRFLFFPTPTSSNRHLYRPHFTPEARLSAYSCRIPS